MKDKEFNAKLIAYLLGKEELFDEVVDELAEKIKKELDETEDDETDDWDEYYKQEDYDYNHECGEENFVDKIIEKVGNKIQKIKQKRERKKIAKNLKEQLELIDGFRWWFSDKMLDLCNVPQEVRYPQCEFLIGKSLIRCLKSREFQGSRIYYLEVVKKDYKEN